MDEHLKLYREIAESLYPDSIAKSGIDVEAIEKAEKQLGFSFPKVLREFYLLIGNHKSINYSHNAYFD